MQRLWALLAILPFGAPAQDWDGVFAAAQSDRGMVAYRDNCARCHGAELGGGESTPALSGAAFLAQWRGKTPLDLLDRTRRTMPTDNPGGLTARQYADTVAYILSVEPIPSGRC